MKYTVQLDFFLDADGVMSDDQVKHIVEEIFDCCNCYASDIKVIEVSGA